MSASVDAPPQPRRWFAAPTPIRSLFKIFPLRVYETEPLPHRAPSTHRPRPVLYIFAHEASTTLSTEDEHEKGSTGNAGAPSFNPSCLKWQTILRMSGLDVDLVPSNNHASPSGALPFLLPTGSNAQPLTGTKILQHARQHGSADVPRINSPHVEAYTSLLTQAIRPAWLHALYLNPQNAPLLNKLYLPSSPLLQLPLQNTLLTAAQSEILKATSRSSSLILPDQLLSDAEEALEALSTLLGEQQWFFDTDAPTEFDADVFSYTWLMLDEKLGWGDDELGRRLLKFENLVAHRERLYRLCWAEKTG